MKVCFITHAGADIGGGHLSRCYALSQALGSLGAGVSWFLNSESKKLAARFGLKDVFFSDNPFKDENLNIPICTDITIVDSYEPGEAFFARLAGSRKLAVIADFGSVPSERYTSCLINYSFNAAQGMYNSLPPCRYLLGPSYALLRRDYWDISPSDGGYVLFAPGAADIADTVSAVIKWWRPNWPRLIAVQGALTPQSARLPAEEIASGKNNVFVKRDPDDFVLLAAGASLVICTASVTAYEALAMRKRVALFTVADNQEPTAEYLRGRNAAYVMGPWESVCPEMLENALSFEPDKNALHNLVNPRGAVDCAKQIKRLFGEAAP